MLRFASLLFVIPFVALAESVDVKDLKTEGEEPTTIEIQKGKKMEAQWEVHDGNQDIEGEPAALQLEARKNWKKSCETWQKEFRTDNKENKIISVTCGSPNCGGETGNKICTSKASYKVKTKMN